MDIIKTLKEQGLEVVLDGSIPIVYLDKEKYEDEEYVNSLKKIFNDSEYSKSYGFKMKQVIKSDTEQE